MKYWITTDWHINHAKIIEYCNRPANFEELILKNLTIIGQDDVLIHFGDICIGKDEDAHNKYVKPLLCKKWLIRGNHDKKTGTWYLQHGWDFIAYSITFQMFGKIITFSHKPLSDTGYDINIHGHFHNVHFRDREKELTEIANVKQKLLVLEDVKYMPILLSKFIGK